MRDNVKGEVNIEMPTLCQHTYEININFRYKIIRTYFESWNRCRYEEAFENLINIVRLTFHKCKVSRHSMTLHNVINTNIILLSKRNRTLSVRCMLHALISCIDILFDDCDMLHFQRYTHNSKLLYSRPYSYVVKMLENSKLRWFIVVQRCILFSALKQRVNCTCQ